MNARKVVAGSVLAAGLGASGLFGAGTAFAGPGVSLDNGSGGTRTVGFGDRSEETGASAFADKGNLALAINLTSKTGTKVIAHGQNNNVVSIDGVATTGPETKNNNVVNAFGVTTVGGKAENNNVLTAGGAAVVNGKRDNVVTVGGATLTDKDSHDNTIINVGGVVGSVGQKEAAPGVVALSVCGNEVVGSDEDHIVTEDAGICSGETS